MPEERWSLIHLDDGRKLFAVIGEKTVGNQISSYRTVHTLVGGVLPHCVIERTAVLDPDLVPVTGDYPTNFQGREMNIYEGKIL